MSGNHNLFVKVNLLLFCSYKETLELTTKAHGHTWGEYSNNDTNVILIPFILAIKIAEN